MATFVFETGSALPIPDEEFIVCCDKAMRIGQLNLESEQQLYAATEATLKTVGLNERSFAFLVPRIGNSFRVFLDSVKRRSRGGGAVMRSGRPPIWDCLDFCVDS